MECNHPVFTSADVDDVAEDARHLMAEADALRARVIEPTKDAHVRAVRFALEYVARHGLVVYGGFARALLEDGSVDKACDACVDVDCHSARPIHDVKRLCDALAADGFKFVNAKNSLHEETYSICIGPQKLCDVSYVPRPVLARLPTVEVGGFRVVHPKLVTLDVLKMLSTPVHTYWRLDKTLERASAFFERHPLEAQAPCERPPALRGASADAACALFDVLRPRRSLLWLGDAAIADIVDGAFEHRGRVLEVASACFLDDVERARRALAPWSPRVDSYHPFLKYWGRRVVVSVDGSAVLIVQDATNMGFHYAERGGGVRVATPSLVYYQLLVSELHGHVHGDREACARARSDLSRLLAAGVRLELPVNCHGRATSVHYQYMMRQIMRKVHTESSMASYRPGSNKAAGGKTLDPDAYRFRNTSGSRQQS
jgi:hypothetical protein